MTLFRSLAFLVLAGAAASAQYTTSFPLTENPISEGGHWLNGKLNGGSWSDCQTTPGFIFGTMAGSAGGYNDSTCVVVGNWQSNQSVQATVACPTQVSNQEVELRLNTTITPGNINGYEINFSCGRDKYNQIVRWNGPLGSFTQIAGLGGTNAAVKTGDIVKAVRVGGVINSYINGNLIVSATDSTFLAGNPGVGFWRDGGGANANFGFSNFTASGGSGTVNPPTTPASVSSSLRAMVTIAWSASTGATSYNVYRSMVSGGPYTLAGSSAGLSYVDSNVQAGTAYYYVVTAVNAAGQSGYSSELVEIP